ncbi:alkanesulfonate monooxygenase [Gordonia araii NBRC 100433]|uniref:Alkanesulfonate monooxygenase n=1 Tax=Gordonia araii NBRC 100433 TaxID=1073574 RepID=G7H5Q1_9ACTN|nr:LLM class flavin-dependent oxidoreductase [Gordonia araii]NNG95888.1 LLM class flavin-dependent oxidoreductase [Gordonia araii NBRC 100433]GAB11176.1 alkanesulfonate monooxygenase [Gordonia araii NBRC 100433]
MTVKLHWFLPTYGDSRSIVGGGHGVPAGAAGGDRDASISYLASIARAAEDFGFTGALTPAGPWCEDAWITTAMLARETRRLAFLIALQPGLISPTLAAQMAGTFAKHAPGRLLVNIVTGGETSTQRAYGDQLDKVARYARTDEFLDIVTALWRGETVTYAGEHLTVENAALPTVPLPAPPIYFGGSSQPAGPVAARHSDVYLTWGEPHDAVAAKIAWIRELAAAQGRDVRFGIRLHVIARDTAEQAWAEAGRLLDALDDDVVAKAQEGLARSESVGQAAMRELHAAHRADGSWRDPHTLEIAPNLWAGVGLVRGGAGTALVGSHREVADAIRGYANLGIDEFILSGYPHLEELYWFGEGVIPQLTRDGLFDGGLSARHPGDPRFAGSGFGSPFLPATPNN